MNKKNIKVSICCATFNQKKYIKEAIESFLKQKTNFDYEIIIHDDCSTDGTTEILKEYEKEYPDKIKVIYQKENQYQQQKPIFPLIFSTAKGKYIALCEGDDYWCDERKIQKQYDFLEKNKECSLVTNGCYVLNSQTGDKEIKLMPKPNSDYYNMEELILGDGSLFATNSMFFRSEYVKKLPNFFLNSQIGDYPLTLYLGLFGKVYFLEDVMSVYRFNAEGSWSSNQNSGDFKERKLKLEKLNEQMKKIIHEFNEYTNNKYLETTNKFLLIREYNYNLNYENYEKLKENKYKKLYKNFTIKGKIKLFLVRNIPYVYKLLKKVK